MNRSSKGIPRPEDPIVEGTRFGWIIHGGEEYGDDKCMFAKETSFDYERLFSLDVLGVEDRGQDDQLQVYEDFKENIVRREDGRDEVHVPWIPGSKLSGTNEQASRGRLANVERKLSKDPVLKEKYEEIVKEQLDEGIIETAPETPTGERTFYMPHKPVIREDTTTTKVRMVFDASARPHPLANSINDCMYTGPPLQPLLWDIMIRTRMSTHILLADIQKAFLQIGIREQDRDAFRFLFNVNGTEQNFRFTRVPFGAEASPFMLGATLQHHYDQQPAEPHETMETFKDEHKPFKETVLYNQQREADEWTELLSRNEFWRTLRVTAWALRFLHNATVNHRAEHRRTDPLIAEEITSAKKHWIRREQRNIPPDLQTSGFELTMEEGTGILKCKGRIQGYQPTYLEGGMFVEKLVRYAHEQVLHLGIANTMAEIRNEFWVPKLRSKVKKIINTCNTCKVFRAKPYGPTPTAVMPTFRTEGGKPFQTTGVDFAGPLNYKLSKKINVMY